MENDSGQTALLVAEGSGGHFIPALETARALAARGVRVRLWYAERRATEPLADGLSQSLRGSGVEAEPLRLEGGRSALGRLRAAGRLWSRAHRCLERWTPSVVVGFGGWVSVPVLLAARWRRIPCIVHEQNVVMGRANRWLARWVDRVAVSFSQTQTGSCRAASAVTGLPVRQAIGRTPKSDAAAALGLGAEGPTLLVLGGSQGAEVLNHLLPAVAGRLAEGERRQWQFIHIAGSPDACRRAEAAYAGCGARARVRPFLVEMEAAYALADLVVARAGASTIAELAQAGMPAILIPYPFAWGHQRANAALVASVGGGVVVEEPAATPERLLAEIRQILGDETHRTSMRFEMRRLHRADAAERLAALALDVAVAAP
jgi:UDP-N-acetylglucosamine--N-acetylmuramyl-(pentapeptide) pyrophosphoryl-undecaprenol N-acetylglucosamine transferase